MFGRLSALTLVLVLACGCSTTAQRLDRGAFVSRERAETGAALRYQAFVPSRTTGGKHPPVILFLHGSGERGTDNLRQLDAGLGPYLRRHADDFPAIVVFPQAPPDGEWIGAGLETALTALDAAMDEFGGDRRRTYLTGISMGGIGVWELALMAPERFAAIVPISSAVTRINPDVMPQVGPIVRQPDPYAALAARLRRTPAWIFHGGRDEATPPEDDRKVYAAMKAAGADARYTEFPEAGHNAWDPAYAMPQLWAWLFAQKRK